MTSKELSFALLGLAACGGASDKVSPKAPADPAMTYDAEPRTVEEAQDRIARARAELETPPAQPGAASATPPAKQEESRRAESGSASACSNPCRALQSMKRAVEALCRMAGDSDTRCTDARRTLDESTSRVASCRC